MDLKKWELLKRCAKCEELDQVPAALIVDSPWIPPYLGIRTIDYYTDMSVWFDANMKIKKEFPEVIFIPDFWVEFGMAAEPSGFGCKVSFFENNTVAIDHIAASCDDIVNICNIAVPNPNRDGLMPLAINYYRNIKGRVHDAGEYIKIVASRGPLNVATHMMGVTEFLLAMKLYPKETHKLLKKTTTLCKQWIEAQANALDYVEGIIVLDDIIGFLSPEDYMEFAHPYFKDLLDAFPVEVKILHNDTDNPVSYPHLNDLGVNIFNFTHLKDLRTVRELVGDNICLMGNIPPLHVLAKGTPDEVEKETRESLKNYGSKKGIIISAGGGASPGMPAENLRAMLRGRIL